jgi:hypothetical protein
VKNNVEASTSEFEGESPTEPGSRASDECPWFFIFGSFAGLGVKISLDPGASEEEC